MPQDLKTHPHYKAVHALIVQEGHALGPLSESVKWGQASFSVPKGTPVRLGVTKTGQIAVNVHCQTTVMREYQALFPDRFVYDGNRGIELDPNTPLDLDGIRMIVRAAFTYRV